MSEELLNQRDLVTIQDSLKRIEALQRDTNGRVTVLERNNIYMRGFLAAVGVVFGLPAILGTFFGVVLMFREI